MTKFIFFEIMSFCSYPLIIHDEKEESKKEESNTQIINIEKNEKR